MTDNDLHDRIDIVDAFSRHQAKLLKIGNFDWNEGFADRRLLATNYILRRQQEALEATVQLARTGLGHLSVGFIRPALDELLWMSYLKDMELVDSQEVMSAMGMWDAVRSLAAQRSYVGDAVMHTLWYPIEMLNQQGAALAATKVKLKALGKRHGWNGLLPSAGWLAEKVDLIDLTEYLHAATSRSLHFSVGEVQRQCWGEPGGVITTKKPEFREHLTEFALYQLPLLLAHTIGAVMPFLEAAGITSDEVDGDEWASIRKGLERLGKVPLVHAREWNLTPDGALYPKTPSAHGGRGGPFADHP